MKHCLPWRRQRVALPNALRFGPSPHHLRRPSRSHLTCCRDDTPQHYAFSTATRGRGPGSPDRLSATAPGADTRGEHCKAIAESNQSDVHTTQSQSEHKYLRWYNRRYLSQLERFLPLPLRYSQSKDAEVSTSGRDLIKILAKAQAERDGPFNLLSRMMLVQTRPQAALHLVDLILKDISAAQSDPDEHLPSTVIWPVALSSNSLNHPVVLERPGKPQVLTHYGFDDQDETLGSNHSFRLGYIWRFLGSLIVESDNSRSKEGMKVVYHTLAKLHHLNLIPANIYNHINLTHSSAVHRPPILHLLSSRILTTLSDATWRSYQDEAISRAAELGISYRETQDPPGGRFRVKVRELGPEVWLEFILWCCVESNCPEAGASIVSLLSKQIRDPWFAVNWTTTGNSPTGVQIDWDRVKLRTGGTVGRIEGYSSEKPLADVPPRTISAEVVLALTESLIDVASAAHGTSLKFRDVVPQTVQNLVGFLEPHNLSEEYFDYLTARLLHLTCSSTSERPVALESLANTLTQIRSFEPAVKIEQARPGMSFRSIVQQSELFAGALQMIMHALSCTGCTRNAIDLFDRILSMVDDSKMQAIASFINTPPEAREGFFNAAPTSGDKDFTMSHGQIPYSRLAVFLNLLTENGIVPLAEWLVYSTDADGPLLPGHSFQRPSVASALVRFAGTTDDPQLLQYVLGAMRTRKLKPPVSLLRLLVNAQIECLNFPAAYACLRALKPAVAGGYHCDNVACIAACILRLEAKAVLEGDPVTTQDYLTEATSLLDGMLQGRFDGNPGDFYIVQRQLFKQQIGHILQICENLASPTLKQTASFYREKFPRSNASNLSPRTFNILLRGIVETAGPFEGARVWNMFCQEPDGGRYPTIEQGFEAGDFDMTEHHDELDYPEDKEDDLSEQSDTLPHLNSQPSVMTGQSPDNEAHVAAFETGASDQDPNNHEETHPPLATNFQDDFLLPQQDPSAPFEDFFTISEPINHESHNNAQQADGQLQTSGSYENGEISFPVVVPNVQTLRIIANKIIDEATSKEGSNSRRDTARQLLDSTWVKERFTAFDLESERLEAIQVVNAENEKGSPMMPEERASVRAREPILTPGQRRGIVVRISELFAKEDERGWVSRIPRRAFMRTGEAQRRTRARRKYLREEGERLGWLYDRMADGKDGDEEAGEEFEGVYEDGFEDGDDRS